MELRIAHDSIMGHVQSSILLHCWNVTDVVDVQRILVPSRHIPDVLHVLLNFGTKLVSIGDRITATLLHTNGTPRSLDEIKALDALPPDKRSEKGGFDFRSHAQITLDLGDIPVCGLNGDMVCAP